MKKTLKNLLFGAGVAAVGLLAYSLWKDTEKPVLVQNANAESGVTSSKEYVAHRRQQIRDAAEARKAAQVKAAQEESVRVEAVQEGADQEDAPNTVPLETGVSEQAAEQQREQ